jgi:diguanylate cyclase (GGDEF)-like protein
MYPAPHGRVLRWLAEIGPDLPEAVQARMRAGFFTSTTPLVVGAVNSIAVAGVAYLWLDRWLFAAIAFLDLLLLMLRLVLLRRVHAPSGPVFATGLLWAGLQGATIACVVPSGDMAMSMVVLASGLAAIGGIVGRNFAAPRYAMAQVLFIDLSYKTTFATTHPQFLPLIAIQTVAFVLMNRSILRHHRAAAVQAILGERESHRRSITDPLTELLNRRGLEEAFDARPPAGAGDRTLLYLDLDGFKQVNDRLGHAAGDAVLREVGRRLAQAIGPDATACRLGGDEFLVLADGLDDAAARRLGGRIITAITAPYQVGGGAFAGIGVSVGVARQRPAASGPPLGLADLMRRADQTLYAAKTAGKGRCILHGAEDAPQVQAA